MMDLKVITPEDPETPWMLDIDIIDGYPTYCEQTQDQRAGVASIISKGTIPGMLDYGIDWSLLLQQERDLTSIDNQVKQQIQELARPEDNKSYMPLYMPQQSGRVDITVYRV